MALYNTLQEVFNVVWNHFVVLKNPESRHPQTRMCLYAGTGCAIGCLVPDKEICNSWDCIGRICTVSRKDKTNYREMFSENIDLKDLKQLQNIHDDACYISIKDITLYMKQELTRFAQEHKLTIPAVAN